MFQCKLFKATLFHSGLSTSLILQCHYGTAPTKPSSTLYNTKETYVSCQDFKVIKASR